jgi:hypothetical protein
MTVSGARTDHSPRRLARFAQHLCRFVTLSSGRSRGDGLMRIANFYSWMTGKHKQEELPAQGINWIDVQDCECDSVISNPPASVAGSLLTALQVPWHTSARCRCPTLAVASSAATDLSQATTTALSVTTILLGSGHDEPMLELIVQVLNRLYPDLINIPKGDASQRQKLFSEAYFFDGGKCANVLGIKYTPLDKCLEDMARCLKQKFGP